MAETRRHLGRACLLVVAVLFTACVGCSSEPRSGDPEFEACVDGLRRISDETGTPLGDAETACDGIVSGSTSAAERPQGSGAPNPVSDPEGYAAAFCRDSLRSTGLEGMARSLGSAPNPEAVARSYAAGVAPDIQPETEAGCLRGLLDAGE